MIKKKDNCVNPKNLSRVSDNLDKPSMQPMNFLWSFVMNAQSPLLKEYNKNESLLYEEVF